MLRDDGQLKSYSSILILTIVMGWHQVSRSEEGESKKPTVNINNHCQGQLTGERWDQTGEKSWWEHRVEKRQKVNRLLLLLLLATSHCTCDAASSKQENLHSHQYCRRQKVHLTNIFLPSDTGEGLKRLPKTEIAIVMIILGLIETGEVSTLGNASHPQSARSHLYQQHHNQAITATNGQNLPKSSPSNTTDQELPQWHRWPHKMYPQLSQ